MTSEAYKSVTEVTHKTVDSYGKKHEIPVVRLLSSTNLETICKTKISTILRLLNSGFTHVFWIDTDAYINNPLPLENFIDNDHDLFISQDINGINAGVMIVASKEMMQEVLSLPIVPNLYEQGAIASIMHKYKVKFLTQKDFQGYFYELYGLNYPQGQADENSFVIHLPGLPNEKRLEVLKKQGLP
jgi:hypothetical protein